MIIVKSTFGSGPKDGRMLGHEEVLGGCGHFEKFRLIVRVTSPCSIAQGFSTNNESITFDIKVRSRSFVFVIQRTKKDRRIDYNVRGNVELEKR